MSAHEDVRVLDPELPWREFRRSMAENYGPGPHHCAHCGQRVWMALQGFFSGGSWTTVAEEEGPGGCGGPEGLGCPEAPDGHHVEPLRPS